MVNTSSDPLDLYAKVEDLLGVKEVAPILYAHYFLFLNAVEFDSLLDVGCGSGDFLRQMQGALGIEEIMGIDLSPVMVSKTAAQGIPSQCIDLCALSGKYDVITAVFDMLNYLDTKALQQFFICVREHLHEGGYFLCDINTLYGFENVAVGSYIVDDEERFLTVDSDFEAGEYSSEFTLFEKKSQGSNERFVKSQEIIKQYYHTRDEIITLSGLEFVSSDDVSLYKMEEADKLFVVLQKR